MSDELKLMTSNIRFDNPADGEMAWPNRKRLYFHTVLDFAPCLLGTQEGREPQLREIEEGLANYKLVDGHRDWIKERMYPCIYVDQTQAEAVESGDIWLSETPHEPGTKAFGSAFPRLCTWVRGKLKTQGRPFFFANVHLDHVKKETRAQQVQVLAKQLKPLVSNDEIFILVGDFNDSPDSFVRQHISQALPELYDPWFILDKNEESSHHQFQGELESGARIDWILVNRLLRPFDIFLDKTQDKGLYPSDHFPVKGVFHLE